MRIEYSHFILSRLLDVLVYARDEDVTLRGDKLIQQRDEGSHRLEYGATKHSGVEIGTGSGDNDIEVCESAETVSESRRTVVQPVIVGLSPC